MVSKLSQLFILAAANTVPMDISAEERGSLAVRPRKCCHHRDQLLTPHLLVSRTHLSWQHCSCLNVMAAKYVIIQIVM